MKPINRKLNKEAKIMKHKKEAFSDDFLQPAFIRFLMRHPTATTIVSAVLGSLLAALLVTLLKTLL